MAARRGLVLGGDGLVQQLQAGDTLGCNTFFTGTAALPTLALLGSATSTVTVAPVVPGDILAVGEVITVTPATALPAGLNISYAIVTAPNTVVIGFTATIAITAASMSWRVAAHR